MKKKVFKLMSWQIALLVLCAVSYGATTTSISQHGITWNFSSAVTYGQFVNGDYWVIGPLTVSSVSPAPTTGRHGSMVNPTAVGTVQGYDNRVAGYSSSARISFPYSMTAGKSMVSTISWADNSISLYDQGEADLIGKNVGANHYALKSAAVLTCLSSTPASDAFRPPYAGTTKPLFEKSDINYGPLPGLDTPDQDPGYNFDDVAYFNEAGSETVCEVYGRYFQRPWILHVTDWNGRMSHPTENMPNYHREVYVIISEASVLLLVDHSDIDELLIPFLQVGIDSHYIIQTGGGADSSIHKWPVIFAGIMFNNSAMKNTSYNYRTEWMSYYIANGSSPYSSSVVPSGETYNGYTVGWRQDPGCSEHEHLWPATEWGEEYVCSGGGGSKRETYRRSNSYTWPGATLSAHVMDAVSYWDHQAFFDYIDRWMTEDEWFPERTPHPGATSSGFCSDMWDAYRYYTPGGNQSPVADAGDDQQVEDTDENGSEVVTLDGSGSYDSDGTITSYVWKEDTTQIATGVGPDVTLDTGQHTITLTVTDNNSATDADNVVVVVVSPGGVTSTDTWQNFVIDNQTGAFTFEFDAMVNDDNIDCCIGTVSGLADGWSDLATTVRFATSGYLDARNSGSYTSDTSVPYSANDSFHIRMEIDISTHTYDVYVTPSGQSEVTLADNYAFRNGQESVTNQDHWAFLHSFPSVTVNNVEVTPTGGDTTAPSPDPMTWATVPYATGTSSISMTATTATDASGVEYYFDCTAGGGNDSGWQDSATYEDTGLSASTQYTYQVKARDKSSNQNETAYSTTKSATTNAADTTAPSPDPMTWATEPYETGSTSISMTATTATDSSGVEYYFDCTAGGGHDSSWQDSATYEDTGLSASTQYTYKVKARDKSSNQNETGYSTTKSATTDSAAEPNDIVGHTADTTVRSDSSTDWNGGEDRKIGGVTSDGVDKCMVYVFELPSIETGQSVTAANFSFYLEDYSYYSPSGNADLYGIDYRSSSTVLVADWYQGTYDDDEDATALQDNIMTGSSAEDTTYNTNSSGDTALKNYLNAQYTGGAEGGDYVFLRINADINETYNHYWKVSTANNSTSSKRPVLTVTIESAGDTTAPSPDPMAWATVPYSTGTSSISMTATTATDASGVEYYFDCTAGGGNDSGWQDSATYEDTGLSASTQYTYQVKARDKSTNQNETAYSTSESATTDAAPDTDPPSPDPMTWATVPSSSGTSSISMIATTATDVSGVEYYFDETSSNPGGSDSGWQDSATYEDTGLDDLTEYTYQVKARDKSTNQNETAYSTSKSATTDALPDTDPPSPDPMTWATVPYATGTSSISMTATTATDASGVEYYFDCTAGGGNDSGWQDSTTYEDTGLSASTQYTYKIQSRDKSSSQNTTGWSTEKSATTDAEAEPNLVAWWKLDETSGITAQDSAGSHNGTLNNGPVWVTGYRANALTFDEVDDYVQISDFDYTSNPNFSLVFWFKIDDVAGTLYQYMFSQGSTQAPNSVNVYFRESSEVELPEHVRTRLNKADGTITSWDTPTTLADGVWHMYALTVSSTDGIEIYIDGNSVVTDPNLLLTSAWDPTTDIYLGARCDLNGDRLYGNSSTDDGLIDDVRIYSQALTDEEVGDIYTEAVPDTTPPSPDPMTWATVPYSTGTSSISMTATTATDPCGVEYYFDETSGNPGGSDSGWQDSSTYEDTGLSASTQYTYQVKARDKSSNQNETGYSTSESATTDAPPDTDPPSPDPMTWATVPYATGTSSISMTATTATDVSGVEYYFDETSGNPGGTDSGWQDSATYEDTGLNELTQYTYRVKARDKSANQNETAYSTAESATTEDGTAPSPDPMTWATQPYATAATSISMTATTATDASGVEYYFDCTAGGGNDSGWQDSATYEDTGISELTQYTYRVKARDKSSNQNETAYSTSQSATTEDGTAPSPDPMTWATVPYATGMTSISMTATTATDASGVEYYFDCTAGGGNDSGWQDSATYEDTGLSAGTQYTYQVQARDKSGNQNATGWSTAESATTDSEAEPNLVAWWKLDETSGITAQDSAGSHNGTLNNGPVWVTGYRGNALTFDEVDDYVQISDFDYTSNPNFSLVFWFKIDDVAGTLYQYMFSHGSTQAPNSVNVYFRESSEAELPEHVRTRLNKADGTITSWDTPTTLADGMWHMYALTVSSTDGIEIYIDGNSVVTDPNLLPTSAWDPTTDIYLGARCDLNGDRLYGNSSTDDGLLDDVRIYDEALSGNEVSNLYNALVTYATEPDPADGAESVDADSTLSWKPGSDANSHDVYLGTDYASVADANQSSSEYKGNFDVNSYDPGGLNYDTTYYWAVDEVNGVEVWLGDVWSFTTEGAADVELVGSWVAGTSHSAEDGNDRVLVLTAHAEDDDSAMSITSVTYGGKSMTKVIEQNTAASGYHAYVGAFILDDADINDASGSSFVVTWQSNPLQTPNYGSAFFANVKQSDPNEAEAGNYNTSNDTVSTSALGTNDGDMVIVAATCGNEGSYAVNNGFTKGVELTITSADGVTGHKAASGSNETPSVTFTSGANRQTILGFVLNKTD